MISSLRKFYQWLLRQDIIERDPLVKIDSQKVNEDCQPL